MHGFVFGIACLVGLAWLVKKGRCSSGGPGGCSRGSWRSWRNYRRRGSFLWRLFERLDTSPGQEKVIRGEIEKLIEQAHGARRVMRQSGDVVAQAMRAESFDESAMGEAFGAQEATLRQLRDSAVKALARVHEVLDARQREMLADILDSGWFRSGPYRGWA